MEIIYQNVRGLSTSVEEVTKSLILHSPDAMILTETWGYTKHPPIWTDLGYNVFSIKSHCTPGLHRQGNGVALLTKHAARITANIDTADMSTITIYTKNTNLAAVYIRPAIGRDRYKRCLDILTPQLRGRCIATGNWNARHTIWDKDSNLARKTLTNWAINHNLRIAKPSFPTFEHAHGSSTVDLTI